MSTRLALLRQLLLETATTRGTVISLQAGAAQVATARGTLTATVTAGLQLKPGDTVTLQDKIITGRLRDTRALRVYDL